MVTTNDMSLTVKTILFIIYSGVCLLTGYFGWEIQMALVTSASLFIFHILRNEKLPINLCFLIAPLIYAFYGFNLHLHVLPIKVVPFLTFIGFRFIKQKIKPIYFYPSLLLLSVLSYIGMQKYLDWESNSNFKDYSSIPFQFKLYSTDSIDLTASILESDSLIVLDCWNNTCGICLRKFPEFVSVQKEFYKDKVAFYTANLTTSMQDNKKSLYLLKKHYGLTNNLFIPDSSIWQKLNINGVPLFIILYRKKIVFIGHLEMNKKTIKHSLMDEIQKQLLTIKKLDY
jgi:thiol-disulfide isomerase/thioredoxin